ncbi:MAG: hypothetical protein NT007_06645 [Candidatus Kapabacteria bacterium]|nr:hypothetical protein [Candidatus Kapabacteria bacterium]
MKSKKEMQENEIENEIGQEIEIENEETDGQNFVDKLHSFIVQNRIAVIGAGIGLVILIGFLIYMFSQGEEKGQRASLALSRVLPLYSSGDFEKALKGDNVAKVRGEDIAGFESIVDQYSGTESGKTAALYAGDCCIKTNKSEEAEKYFEIAAKSKSTIIITGANAGLGMVREIKGDFKEASTYYEKASQNAEDEVSKLKYQFYSALCLEKSGDNQKAEKIYKDIIAENQYSEFANQAKTGLIRLGTIIE